MKWSSQPAEPRRTLQLSAILVQLRDGAVPDGATAAAEASGGPTSASGAGSVETAPRRRRRFRRRAKIRSNITIGEILDRTREAGFGFIAALLALIAVPFVGLSTPFGLAIAFLAVQMIVGLHRPWLPERLRRHRVSMTTLEWLGRRLAHWTAGLERIIRPRFPFMTTGLFWTACGVGILVQGLGLSLPLPIPGSNWIFIIPIILYGIGLLEADGLLIMVCHTITVVQLALGVWLSETIVRALTNTFHWFSSLLG